MRRVEAPALILVNICRKLWRMDAIVLISKNFYHTSVNLDIYDKFQQRYQMHKQIYNHPKGKAVQFMICDAMLEADRVGDQQCHANARDFSISHGSYIVHVV
ncbi:hypothetical protein PsorP6_011355 [Peronosclerospora sorghi]|uniref:Uncharacterized protein n=1 Tax=Peronosclerospora sorghi TaxID=230839 RepID=A0ACC0WLK3_9STRA|nr:hypothetical protein PsorP6_011355 [Peronosclerospora sorghi]